MEIAKKLKEIEERLSSDDVEKSNICPVGHITEHPDGSLSQKQAPGEWIYLPYNIKDLSDKQTGDDEKDKRRAREIIERMNLAIQAPVIKKINPIKVPNGNEKFLSNFLKPYLDKIDNEIKNGNLRCRANGKTVVQFLRTHCYKNKNGIRKNDDLQNHAGYLPFVIPLIKKYGITDKSMNRVDNKGGEFIELVGRADIINPNTNKKERVGISIVLVTLGNKKSLLKDISVFKIFDKYSLIKSFQHSSMDTSVVPFGVGRNSSSRPHASKIIAKNRGMSSEKLKQLQKSLGLDDIQFQTYLFSKENHKNDTFAVVITDITENNKEKKVEQLQKSLNCVDRQQPFSVRHIKSDILSQRYDDITLVISNFNKDKIEKAVNTVSFALDVKPKSKHKGEQFFYKAQENLTDEIIIECFEKVKKMYLFVLNYFALPDVRIVAKADLKYKGKIIYNPETGEPIKLSEWKSFIKAFQSFIDKEFKLLGRKIALKGQVLGRMLQRLSKRYSLSKLKKVELEDLEVKNKKIDWISENTKNIKDVFGESIDRKTQAKIETANLSATQKIQQITDNEQNKIKNILIDGIKNKESKAKISQKLFDSCVGMNRDFQRIVDTELQNNTNSAYIQEEVFNAKEGERIYFKRSEIIDDVTCVKCKKLKDTVAIYSPIPLDDENVKDEFAKYAIWDGKEGTEWKAPIGTMHPYCRGFWYRFFPVEISDKG